MKELTINLKQDFIPINLVDPETNEKHAFKYRYDDETLNGYRDELNPVVENLKKAKETSTFEEVDNMLKEAFEFILGPGEYERIKKVQNSIINRQSLIFEIIKLIETQLSTLMIEKEESEADKYVVD